MKLFLLAAGLLFGAESMRFKSSEPAQHTLGDRQRRAVDSYFNILDQNGDGAIEEVERLRLESLLTFFTYDANRDLQITRQQFFGGTQYEQGQQENPQRPNDDSGDLTQFFNWIDADGNGVLTLQEAINWHNLLNEIASQNPQGSITLEGFQRWAQEREQARAE